MDHLLLDLEIDAACWEFIARRILARGGSQLAQPVVIYLDNFCDTCEADPCMCTVMRDQSPDEDTDPWDELTAECQRIGSGPETVGEMTERMLGKMGV
jgi:hypothetical protein